MNVNVSPDRQRIISIDVLRGLVMVIMALDHTRDYFHETAFTDNPLNLATTTGALFFTRWITHFCAPTFVFLAGTSACLMGLKKTKAEMSSFLIKRGIWLILVELFIITLFITFNPFYNVFILQVIWAIGISMVLLGVAVRLPFKVILIIGLLIFLGHNLIDYPEAERNGQLGFWWTLVHGAFGTFQIWPHHVLAIFYSFLSWTGIMFLGYCFGKCFDPGLNPAQRKRILIGLGWALILVFIALRFINLYGDPVPWSVQRNGFYTFLSFINTNKYPPSLMYTCMTLGPSILFLSFIEKYKNRFTSFCRVYGRVPFFYYVVHFFLIHFLNVIFFFISGFGIKDIVNPKLPLFFLPPHYGFGLWIVYGIWISVVLLLYVPCKWYDKIKSSRKYWWMSYL